jgi:solute carrier family 25 protein 34/35
MLPLPGFYEPIRKAMNRFVGLSATEQTPVTSVLAGAASGVVGGRLFNTTHHMPRLISLP